MCEKKQTHLKSVFEQQFYSGKRFSIHNYFSFALDLAIVGRKQQKLIKLRQKLITNEFRCLSDKRAPLVRKYFLDHPRPPIGQDICFSSRGKPTRKTVPVFVANRLNWCRSQESADDESFVESEVRRKIKSENI